ncbi:MULTISPECIES: restriction endonuclease [unclassified Mycobacterium]|uniref:restriction endonuclease n=1 Tax=unclassified Mycobacterium TaxID=2642494 RepID=UPI0029C88A1B|nr:MULTISPECIES: restriction endonuclease [unclassified Mycobacterium]
MSYAWKEYQEEAAAYYRELGLSAETDETIVGARGKHAIDVVVRGHRAGVEFLWLIECKWWNRRVPKAAVLTLGGVMLDVGADRGIMLSRRGFQSGAPAMAAKSNVTLTSLEELKESTASEYIEYRCDRLRRRCDNVVNAIHTSGLEKLRRRDDNPLDWPDIVIGARANQMKTAIEEGLGRRWPVGITRVKDGLESYAFIDNMSDLLAVVEYVLDEIEQDLDVAISQLGS